MPFDEDFESIQEQEIESLRAIYGDDFTASHNQLKIKLRPTQISVQDSVSILLIVKLPPTYPSASPIIKFENIQGISASSISSLIDIVNQKLPALKGTESIFEITSLVEEFLSNNNSAFPQISFHEEYTTRKAQEEAEAMKRERDLEESSKRKQEEDLVLNTKDLANQINTELAKKRSDGVILWKIYQSDFAQEVSVGPLIKKGKSIM